MKRVCLRCVHPSLGGGQRAWIGRSDGARVEFRPVPGAGPVAFDTPVHVYTTRIETLLGVTFVAIAPDHALALAVAARSAAVREYLSRPGSKTDVRRSLASRLSHGRPLRAADRRVAQWR